MEEINLYFDESGNLGSGMGRYFLICALEIDNDQKKSIAKRSRRVIWSFKDAHFIPKSRELKGTDLNDSNRIELLNKITYRGVKIRYIVLDKKNTTMLLTKVDDKNACFNYLVQLIVKAAISSNPKINKVNLFLDNRSVKIGNRLSLKPYLYNKFVMENLEINGKEKRIEFNITYYESESCYLIQWADIVSNSLYKKYNSDNNKYYNIIKKHIVFESKFPSKKFGK